MRVVMIVALAWIVAGCASPSSPQFSVPAGQYARAFDATRDVLRGYRFSLERVDAAAGVVTTAPKGTAGLATPWDAEQSTMAQEVEDLLNQQTRNVRVTFRPAVGAGESIDPSAELVGRVEVIVYRMQTPGLRPPSKAISMTSLSVDPVAGRQGLAGQYEVPVAQDSRLAARLAAAIERRLGRAGARGAQAGETPPRVLARP